MVRIKVVVDEVCLSPQGFLLPTVPSLAASGSAMEKTKEEGLWSQRALGSYHHYQL